MVSTHSPTYSYIVVISDTDIDYFALQYLKKVLSTQIFLSVQNKIIKLEIFTNFNVM